jgi:hypothetical protein
LNCLSNDGSQDGVDPRCVSPAAQYTDFYLVFSPLLLAFLPP